MRAASWDAVVVVVIIIITFIIIIVIIIIIIIFFFFFYFYFFRHLVVFFSFRDFVFPHNFYFLHVSVVVVATITIFPMHWRYRW